MRLFVALLFDADLRAQVAAERERLQRQDAQSEVRWVADAALHLTLRFIGEESESRLPEWVNRLSRAVRGREAPLLGMGAAGAFPNLARPRVLWLGLREHGTRLRPLQAAVDDATRAMGLPEERRTFQPHVTLGRVRASRDRAPARLPQPLLQALRATRASGRPEPQQRLALMRSQLSARGATYEPLHRWDLPANDSRTFGA